jgi:hypothetical protein
VPWTEATDMEDGIKVQIREEFEMIVKVSDLFEDFVQAELLGSELRRFLVDLDILNHKPDYISNIKDMGQSFVPFELFLHSFLG